MKEKFSLMLPHSDVRLSSSVSFSVSTPEKFHDIEKVVLFESVTGDRSYPTHPVAGKLKGSWCVKVVAGMGVCRNVSDGVICWTEKGL